MAVTSGFFDSSNGDRKYNSSQFASIFDGIIYDGVFRFIGNALAVTRAGGMYVSVGTGRAWFNRTWTNNDTALSLLVPAAELVLHRRDLVILEVNTDLSVRQNTIKILKGTPASSPVEPTLTNTATVKQYKLAAIYVAATTTNILDKNITNYIGTASTPYSEGIFHTTSGDLQVQIDGKAPISHASAANTYGLGTHLNYGHVKVFNALTLASPADGVALQAYQGYVLKAECDKKVMQAKAYGGAADTKHFKDLAAYSAMNNVTGTIKITLPVSWTSTMMEIKLSIFDYSGYGATELVLSGYNYVGAPANWISTAVKSNGVSRVSAVRFGHDGSKCCILLGYTSTQWTYPHIEITDVIAHNAGDALAAGWSISVITSETGIGSLGAAISPGYVPINHATAETKYGLGTVAAFGHNNLENNVTQAAYSDGHALSANQGYLLNITKRSMKQIASAGVTKTVTITGFANFATYASAGYWRYNDNITVNMAVSEGYNGGAKAFKVHGANGTSAGTAQAIAFQDIIANGQYSIGFVSASWDSVTGRLTTVFTMNMIFDAVIEYYPSMTTVTIS